MIQFRGFPSAAGRRVLYTPGAVSRSVDPFRGRRVSSGRTVKRSRRRGGSEPVFEIPRGVVIGVVLLVLVTVVAGGMWLGGRIFGRSRSGHGAGRGEERGS